MVSLILGHLFIPDKLRNYGVDLLKVPGGGESGSIEKKKLNRGNKFILTVEILP